MCFAKSYRPLPGLKLLAQPAFAFTLPLSFGPFSADWDVRLLL